MLDKELNWFHIHTLCFSFHFPSTANTNLCKNYQGGLSDGYKKYIAEKELPDETYTKDGIALFRVQGSGPENMQSIQVEPVSAVIYSIPPPYISLLKSFFCGYG